MAEDTLMLNVLSDSTPSFLSKKVLQRPTAREKWALKKSQRSAVKRPASSGAQEEEEPVHKQSRREHAALQPSGKEEDLPPSRPPKSPVSMPSKAAAKCQSPEKPSKPQTQGELRAPPKAQAQTKVPLRSKHVEQKREQRSFAKERKGEQNGEERLFVKTSSLFRNNPDIPELLRPAVTQLKEKVFTSTSFSELDLHPHLVATLKVLNVTSMTSVQQQTIPVLLSGQDAVVRSQTGSGKTLAYGIPLVQSLQAVEPKIQRGDGPFALIVVPTRELAQQSFQIIQKLLKPFNWVVPGVLMGGEKRKAEKARLRKGINILIGTPGRLVDHIKNTLSIAFSAVRWLILDEADRTLDLGFEKDLTVILNTLNATGPPRQNVLLSATLSDGLSRLAAVCMKDPVSIQVADNTVTSQASCDITGPTPDPTAQGQSEGFAVPERLQQHMVVIPSKLRLVCLAAFILDKCQYEQGNQLMVFVSSCEAVEFLLTVFKAVLCGPAANQKTPLSFLCLHGNMKQEERTEVFQEFSQSKSGILLCTDVAARGLHLPHVTWIIQYNPPTTAAEYVHRVGRTARIGEGGSSLLFLTPAETAYVSTLANHNISLSEMKMQTLLAPLMMDDRFKGRGRWHGKDVEQQVRERATVLQTEFENFVHANEESVQAAKKALQSFLRAYTTYPSSLKHIFHIRSLHLGHAAKSFGLRDAPAGGGAMGGTGARGGARGGAMGRGQVKGKEQRPKKPSTKERVASLMFSEYASGMEGGDSASMKKRKKKRNAQKMVEEDNME